jgi:hypothetical protein
VAHLWARADDARNGDFAKGGEKVHLTVRSRTKGAGSVNLPSLAPRSNNDPSPTADFTHFLSNRKREHPLLIGKTMPYGPDRNLRSVLNSNFPQ